ncbi:endonuclease domain-containing protein, partial [Armatimonas sp.]|uniref:endonuclease domain-containing protein n=1 Tax=Armatimonas sp. TaxID=1872638 RepID=UPI00286BD4EF
MKAKPRYWRGASPELQHWAWENRVMPTEAEEALWEALRGKRLAGLRFRRQHAYETSIFDFYCPEFRLIVEVDGGYHSKDFQQEKDTDRDAYLQACGFRTVRLTNEEVLQRLPTALDKILQAINRIVPPPGANLVPYLLLIGLTSLKKPFASPPPY